MAVAAVNSANTQNPKVWLSIIIPTYNEAATILNCITYLQVNSAKPNTIEIIIVDGGSTDNTLALAKTTQAMVYQSPKGRALQQNFGALQAKGQVLYFLHADTLPPKNFDNFIYSANLEGSLAGCFRMQFNHHSKFLAFFAYFTKFNTPLCRGGDQSLFVQSKLFRQLNGFNKNYVVYEDVEFIKRLYKATKFKVLRQKVTTSARKYELKGFWYLQWHFSLIHLKSRLGYGPQSLAAHYQKYIQKK